MNSSPGGAIDEKLVRSAAPAGLRIIYPIPVPRTP